jgi:hypothetical protein
MVDGRQYAMYNESEMKKRDLEIRTLKEKNSLEP